MVVKLLGVSCRLQVDGAYIHLIYRYFLQLAGKVRLSIGILWRNGLVARLFQRLLIRCAVLLYQRYVVGAIVLLGSSYYIGLSQTFNALNLIECILPGLTFREQVPTSR